jgi:hypothetical protein
MKQRLGHPVSHMDVRVPRERRIACSGPLALAACGGGHMPGVALVMGN